MNKYIGNKEVKECKKKAAKIQKDADILEKEYDKLKKTSGCISCKNYSYTTTWKVLERYNFCKECRFVGKLNEMAIELHNKIKEYNDYLCADYARVVFNICATDNPKLKDRKSGKITTWEEVYGKDFNSLTTSQKNSLICLIEEDGGLFRFA